MGWGQGGPNSKQAHDVVTTSMRRNDVTLTSFRGHVPTRFLRNQCQIITFLLLKSDIIENLRIELRGIVIIGGGAKVMLAPLSNYWGACSPPPPLPMPMYANRNTKCKSKIFVYGVNIGHVSESICICVTANKYSSEKNDGYGVLISWKSFHGKSET